MSLETRYTNGFDFDKVWAALKGRLGWRQPTVASPALNDDNKASVSGRFFDGFHALCNIVNIKNIQQDAAITDADFNTLLQSMYKDIAMRCLSGVFNEPEFIEDVLLYQKCSYNETPIGNSGLFAGYQIELPPNSNISAQVTSISLYFNAVATFKVYLFKEGVQAAIWEKEVTTVANSETVVDVDIVLQYLSALGHGNRFYFGYFQDDLGACQAIKTDVEWNKTLCFSACPYSAVKIADEINFQRKTYYQTVTPFGLNMVIGSFRDHTQLIVKKAFLFDEIIGLQMATQVVENIMHSTRSNGSERILKEQVSQLMVYMDLKGTVPISDAPQTTGIANQIQRELTRLKKSFLPKPKAVTITQD